MYCKKCGNYLGNQAKRCPYCGTKVKFSLRRKLSFLQNRTLRWILLAVAVVLAVVLVIVGITSAINGSKCRYSHCSNKKTIGDYCSYHVCTVSGCTKPIKSEGSKLCYMHDYLNSAGALGSNAQNDLKFSNIDIEHNSSYTVVTGKMKNNGETTYSFVQIKGAFTSSNGKVVDTDWTYAVGSEGISPGESVSFRMSVPKDTSITKCDISIIDYN